MFLKGMLTANYKIFKAELRQKQNITRASCITYKAQFRKKIQDPLLKKTAATLDQALSQVRGLCEHGALSSCTGPTPPAGPERNTEITTGWGAGLGTGPRGALRWW